MITKVIMPKFGLSMEEGTVAEWLCAEGEEVKKGQAIAEITSEKLTNTAEAPEDGILRRIVVQEGESAACGEVICIIADADDVVEDTEPAGDAAAAGDAAPEQSAPAAAPAAAPESVQVKITPRARKLAEEKGLEYAHITGTGIGGAITIEDINKFGRPKTSSKEEPDIAPASASQSEGELRQMTTMQSAISKAMFESLAATAQPTLATEANVEKLVRVYHEFKARYAEEGIKLSYTAMLIKAVAHALENHPEIRAKIVDQKSIRISSNIDIGIAVDIPGGLVVPVLRNANLKDLRAICLELASLAIKARAGRLVEGDMGGAVTTITNLGMFDVTYFTPILNVPESTILGVGSIVQKPVFRDRAICFDHLMYLSLTHDHRALNGAPCARFLQEVTANLQNFIWC